MSENWIEIGRVSDIPALGARVVKTHEMNIGVFKTADGSIYAIEDKCPHRGGPLSQGIVHDEAVTCPLHSVVISLKTGIAANHEDGCVRTIPVKIEGERILIDLAAAATRKAA
ncbi:nitrite reductase small subunit NirD [Consotaella aegiceratis]|uniref:nitrite reductase small subunit NirD n=1 Tax=Consotaella aegiceratis TaxID=3097961 RepID=UPI002F42EB29